MAPLEAELFNPGAPVAALCLEGRPRRPRLLNPLGLPAPLTARQLFYIWGPQCIGAMLIDGGANFGIACAMYRGQKNILMWPIQHNTIAGDMAVTIFIQGILTFVLSSALVHVDLRNEKIAAFPYPWPDQQIGKVELKNGDPEMATTKRGKLWRTFHSKHGLGRGLHFFSGSAVNDLFDFSIPRRDTLHRLFWSVWKGSVLSALYFLVVWPLAIACVAPHWGHRQMAGTWAPETIKGVFGAVYGLIMTPIVACIAMGSEDSVRAHRAEVHQRNIEDIEKHAPMPTTMAEMVHRPPKALLA